MIQQEKLKAAKAELTIRQRHFNAAMRDLAAVVKRINKLEAQIEKLERIK